MRKKNVKIAEIILLIAVILFAVLTFITYRNLSILTHNMPDITATETTTIAEQ